MMIRSAAVVALLSLGCGKATPKPDAEVAAPTAPTAPVATPDAAPAAPDAAPAAEVAAAAPDCVPHDVMAVLGSIDPDFAKLDQGVVSLCGYAKETTRYCVGLDLASGKRTSAKLGDDDIAHLPQYPAGFDDGLVKDDDLMRKVQAKDTPPVSGKEPAPPSGAVLKVCPAEETRCKDLHGGNSLAGHFSQDKSRVVVTSLDEGKLNAHIYTTSTQAEELVVPIADSELPNCTFAAFAGDALVVSTGACGGAGKAWLVDSKTGTKIADIGKIETAFVRDGQFAHVDGDVFVFRDASGKTAYVQDVKTGEVKATIDLEKASDGTTPKDDAAFVFATPTQIVFVEARPLVDTIIVASPTDGSVTKVHVPRPCPN